MNAGVNHDPEVAERHRRAQKFSAAIREANDQLVSGIDPKLCDDFTTIAERVQTQLDAVVNRRRRELELQSTD